MPATPQGLHRVVDPEVARRQAARERLARALPLLSEAGGKEVSGNVGDADPLAAVADALNLRGFDEIIVSTLPWRLSRWLRVDLPRKLRGLGVPCSTSPARRRSSATAIWPRLRERGLPPAAHTESANDGRARNQV